MSQFIIEPERKVPVINKVDVLVAGAGPAGLGAVVAAARAGANTLVIERYGFLGGMLTAGFVLPLPCYNIITREEWRDEPGKPCYGGIAKEFVDRLVAKGGAIDPNYAVEHNIIWEDALNIPWTISDPEVSKYVAQEMMEEAGIKMLLHSLVVGAIVENNKVQGVIVENKSGRQAIRADVVIDSTGDGDVATFANASFKKSDIAVPMTLFSILSGVDVEKALPYCRDMKRQIETQEEAYKRGEIPDAGFDPKRRFGSGNIFLYCTAPKPGDYKWNRTDQVFVWGPHYSGDCTNVEELTKAELSTRKKLREFVNYFKKHIQGFENAYISATPTQIGLRESRRVVGGYALTFDDIKEGRKFDDVVLRCRSMGERFTFPRKRFDIPWRCFVPEKIDQLIPSGRCISLDHDAFQFNTPREELTCMATGEVAGIMAALASKEKIKIRDIEISELQERLRKSGVL